MQDLLQTSCFLLIIFYMFFNEILKIVEHLDLLFMVHTIVVKTIVAKNCEKGKIFSKLLST